MQKVRYMPQLKQFITKTDRPQFAVFIRLYKAKAMRRKSKKFRLNLVNFVKKPSVRLKGIKKVI